MNISAKAPDIRSVCVAAAICGRCTLRFAGVRDIHLYSAVQAPTSKATRPTPCTVCLGVLNETVLAEVTSAAVKVLSRVAHAGTFKITVALPPAAAIVRTAAAATWLRTVLGETGEPGRGVVRVGDVVSLREAFKWAISDRVEARTSAVFNADAEVFIDVKFSHEPTNVECTRLVGATLKARRYSRKSKKKFRGPQGREEQEVESGASTVAVQNLLQNVEGPKLRELLGPSFFPPQHISEAVTWDVRASVANLLLAGFYNKYSRRVSQTPWFLDGPGEDQDQADADSKDGNDEMRARKTKLCVEDAAVEGIRAVLRPERITFTAGGREDVDVRMLGSGRPFIVDLVNPCIVPSRVTTAHIEEICAHNREASDLVSISGLRVVPKSYAAQMRACEVDKRKNYRCVVWTGEPLKEEFVRSVIEDMNSNGGTKLFQKTPLRVLHRRTLMTRERMIYSASVSRFLNRHVFVLDLQTQAGTYVKEACHGDLGRTDPSLSSLLGCETDILQLDVASVEFQA